ncbi:hypothetical protein [Actinomadura sp. HBU206391]|uniref:hypothetical protein n=1 Tax=Actinomadura sp. HBU206391 TaxID=2731692 RepID=UPI00164FFA79|nr:hypothetical protein [Actinomadura sp. HBU206391]MBC6460208.1 hypothetical protein [Actinomadura sp. HBU206391]
MVRALRGRSVVVYCVVVLGLLAGCGNKSEVCDETKAAFEGLAAQVRTAPATDAAQWKQAVDRFAARLDALAKKSDDAKLKKTLEQAVVAARGAATGAGNGDVAQLQRFLTEQPRRIGETCS